uniref:Uncharacterized protein n=1 Tax=Escherichia coli TaxID=562 RepID=A0A6J4D178_ECOLX|nr:hypothetical protein [Escherichia coli]
MISLPVIHRRRQNVKKSRWPHVKTGGNLSRSRRLASTKTARRR